MSPALIFRGVHIFVSDRPLSWLERAIENDDDYGDEREGRFAKLC